MSPLPALPRSLWALSLLSLLSLSWARPASADPGARVAIRAGLTAAKAAGLDRAARRELGRSLSAAARAATRADRRDLGALLRDGSLRVELGARGPALVGGEHRATLVEGKLRLESRRLEWAPQREPATTPLGFRFLVSGPFRYRQPGVKAIDTASGREVELPYAVYGRLEQDRRDPRRVIVFDPTVEPVDTPHTYRYKPGPGAMKQLLGAVGKEVARLYPDAEQMVVWRDRDTAGYGAGSGRDKQKTMAYDLRLFRR
jgi:hypothetical protein